MQPLIFGGKVPEVATSVSPEMQVITVAFQSLVVSRPSPWHYDSDHLTACVTEVGEGSVHRSRGKTFKTHKHTVNANGLVVKKTMGSTKRVMGKEMPGHKGIWPKKKKSDTMLRWHNVRARKLWNDWLDLSAVTAGKRVDTLSIQQDMSVCVCACVRVCARACRGRGKESPNIYHCTVRLRK